MNKKTATVVLALSLLLFLDQAVKVYIKTKFTLGEELAYLGDWAKIHFTENAGFAFGMSWGGNVGKIILSTFRLIVSFLLLGYLFKLLRKKTDTGVIVGLTLITAGALGNLIDCVFYGVIFGPSTYHTVASFMPEQGGYSTWMLGRVVDMFYFPIIKTHYPNWVPFVSGEELIFFRFIFNIADAAITSGVFYLLLFRRNFLLKTID